MRINHSDIPFSPDVVWASPPCTCFSVASIGKHWNKDRTPKTKEAEISIQLVKRTTILICELMPRFWFLENPRGMLRTLDFMQTYPGRRTVTYCQYGDTRMKPTDIWTNCTSWKNRPPCKNGAPCHERAPRGSKRGTQGLSKKDRWRVPYQLLEEIIIACEESL
jgi:site-specific DNA-cytosine methylase